MILGRLLLTVDYGVVFAVIIVLESPCLHYFYWYLHFSWVQKYITDTCIDFLSIMDNRPGWSTGWGMMDNRLEESVIQLSFIESTKHEENRRADSLRKEGLVLCSSFQGLNRIQLTYLNSTLMTKQGGKDVHERIARQKFSQTQKLSDPLKKSYEGL